MMYFAYRVTQKVAIFYWCGAADSFPWELLTLIRVGSLKLLRVIIQNKLNAWTRAECFWVLTADLHSQERQRRYLSLSPWDKATLSLVRPKLLIPRFTKSAQPSLSHPPVCVSQGRAILSNKMARTVAFFYTLFLHCLVFLVCGSPEEHLLLYHLYSKISPVSLWCSFRCYTRPRGARALAETAPLSVLKSEIVYPSESVLLFLHGSHSSIVACVPNRYADHLHQFHENDPNL